MKRVDSAVKVLFVPAVVWLKHKFLIRMAFAFISSNGKPHKLEIMWCLFYEGATIHVTDTGRVETAQNPPVYQQSFPFTSHHFQGITDIPSPSPATHTLPRCSQQRRFHLSSKVVPLHGRHMTFNASWVWGIARNLALLRWFAKELVKKQWLGSFQYG